jgi:hypothetical protein
MMLELLLEVRSSTPVERPVPTLRGGRHRKPHRSSGTTGAVGADAPECGVLAFPSLLEREEAAADGRAVLSWGLNALIGGRAVRQYRAQVTGAATGRRMTGNGAATPGVPGIGTLPVVAAVLSGAGDLLTP